MPAPLVSFCMPTLNARRFLAPRIESLLAQTVGDFEVVVCDSGSTDGTVEMLARVGDERVRVEQVPRAGPYAGLNECLRRATGTYVAFAMADDTAAPDFLEKMLVPLERRAHLDIALCRHAFIDADGRKTEAAPAACELFYGDWLHTPSVRNGQAEFLVHAGFGHTVWLTLTALLLRRRVFDKTGLFPTDLGSRGDEAWTLRACLASDVAFVPEKLATWRRHDAQSTPLRLDRLGAERLLAAIESVIADDAAGVPPSWKTVDRWRRRLTATHRHRVRLRSPAMLLADVAGALRSHPLRLLREALREGVRRDLPRHTRELLRAFGAAWPPVAVDAW